MMESWVWLCTGMCQVWIFVIWTMFVDIRNCSCFRASSQLWCFFRMYFTWVYGLVAACLVAVAWICQVSQEWQPSCTSRRTWGWSWSHDQMSLLQYRRGSSRMQLTRFASVSWLVVPSVQSSFLIFLLRHPASDTWSLCRGNTLNWAKSADLKLLRVRLSRLRV